jgi:hypothetical protein
MTVRHEHVLTLATQLAPGFEQVWHCSRKFVDARFQDLGFKMQAGHIARLYKPHTSFRVPRRLYDDNGLSQTSRQPLSSCASF